MPICISGVTSCYHEEMLVKPLPLSEAMSHKQMLAKYSVIYKSLSSLAWPEISHINIYYISLMAQRR